MIDSTLNFTLLTTSRSIWLLYFVNAFQSSLFSNLLPFVTSDFESHSLLNVIYIVADAMTAAIYIPLSKVLDVWGRAEGFLVMSFSATLGLILMAVSHNLPTFCAAYVRHFAQFARVVHELTIDYAGLLLTRLLWYNILHRCDNSRCIVTSESRLSLRFHLLSIYDHGVCWSCGIQRHIQHKLALGLRLLRDHLSSRCSTAVRHSEDEPQEGEGGRSCSSSREWAYMGGEYVLLRCGVRW